MAELSLRRQTSEEDGEALFKHLTNEIAESASVSEAEKTDSSGYSMFRFSLIPFSFTTKSCDRPSEEHNESLLNNIESLAEVSSVSCATGPIPFSYIGPYTQYFQITSCLLARVFFRSL